MSRIGKKPIIIPPEVEIKVENNLLRAKGPKGEASLSIPKDLKVIINGQTLKVVPLTNTREANILWGTTRAHLNNLIKGLVEEFKKELEIEGVGYRASVENGNLVLKVGFINLVNLKIPEGIKVEVEKNTIKISGCSKEKVGQFAAQVRRVKPVEPYKGKGIHYVGEKIRRKAGKKLATTAS